MKLDQTLVTKALQARLDRTTDARHRAMLETLIAHSDGEIAGDLPKVLGTLVDDPQYYLWHDGRDVGPKGIEAVTAFYTALVHSGAFMIEAPVQRIVMDDDNIVTEIAAKQMMPGTVAIANGYTVDDPNAFYLIEFRAVLLWPFAPDGRLLGEDAYTSRNLADIRKVDDADVPDSLRELVAAGTDRPYVFTSN